LQPLSEYRRTHLVENARVQLASDYMLHEFRKIFHDLTYEETSKAITPLAPNDKSEDVVIRDFWNLFCALSSTWRIKDLYVYVTAENVTWKKEEVSVTLLAPCSPQGWLKKIDPYRFDKAVAYLRDSRSNLSEALKEAERERGGHADGDQNDPIIVISDGAGYSVLDGNGRFNGRIVKWISEGGGSDPPVMTTWVGYSRGNPRDFWVPTSSLCFMESLRVTSPSQILGTVSSLALAEYLKRVRGE